MAYHLHHIVRFYNCLNEKLYIELHKKDVEPVSVTELRAISFAVQYPTGDGGTFDTPIISCEAKLTLYLETTDNEEFDDFIVTFADEWKMIAYDEAQNVFVGFLTPGEGRAEFQDKPYEITLSAVDGLGLLKGVPLTKDDGTNFTSVNLIIDYIIAILNKTGLGLDLRLISNIIEESMEDRTQNEQADTFNQTGLHARTFLQNPTVFYDCYTCLERILSEYFCLYQWYGKWVILRIGELQASVGAKVWHSEYNSSGDIVSAQQSLVNPGAVGRDSLLHPVELAQFIGSNFSVKSAKYTYNYNVWPEIPTNNKFERGTPIPGGSGSNPDGTTFQKYTIADWVFGRVNPLSPSTFPPNMASPAPDIAYRLETFNIYGIQENREIILENGTIDGHRILQCDPIPIKARDRVNISFDFKFSPGGTGTLNYIMIYLVPSAGLPYRLENSNSTDGGGPFSWVHTGALRFLSKFYDNGENWGTYSSFNIETPEMPEDGMFYVGFLNFDSTNTLAYYKNFNLDYLPYVNGSLRQVSGDYAQTLQTERLKDAIEEEVFISDSQKKVFQGALYRENLTDLTTPTWHRYNVVEQRHFKELGELARFNNNYRRMWKIEGQFDGLKFAPADDMTRIEPLSFHRHFAFPDSSKLNGHYFALVPPLTLNYSEGRADMNFIEVLQDGSNDGNNTGDSHIPIQYIFG